MSSHGTFATALNCMDGRAVPVVIDWMKNAYGVDHVDTITEPGMDSFISCTTPVARAWLKRKIEISVKNHGSRAIAIVGHDQCAGNPVAKDEHLAHITKCITSVHALVREIDPALTVDVLGLWVYPSEGSTAWSVDKV